LNTDGFINESELASVCSVSVRTIQLDIKEINKLLKEYNAQINSEVTEKSKEILRENNIH
jgi:lichenan operon transcriptional antiterminator